ncbi:MAG: AtpZ/AtpI family protein [Sphingobacteriaceae bacterium]
METKKSGKKTKIDGTDSLKAYARYAGIGFQMVAIIGLFTFIGLKLDDKFETHSPIFTAIFALLGVCLALYQVIRSVLNTKK